jgi:hypothetical protein
MQPYWAGVLNQEVDGFGVEVSTEALKLRRQQDRVGVIELPRRIATTWPPSAERAMGRGDLRERALARAVPIPKSK